jgi:hypothetical protein
VNNIRATARQLLGGLVATEMKAQATIKELQLVRNGEVNTPLQQEVLLGTMFSVRPMQSGYEEQR